MKLGIDISQIVYKGTGVARFTDGLVNAILDHNHEHDWMFFFSSLRQNLDDEIKQKIESKAHRLVKLSIPPTLLSILHNDIHVPITSYPLSAIRFSSFDWFITSDWTEPSVPCKKATIIHDLVFKRYPETVHPTIHKTQEKRLTWVKKESKLIFADSQSTADDLQKYYEIEEKRIVVNYPGITNNIGDSHGNLLQNILQKYNITQPFILTVGKLEPRKNIQRLIEAFSQIPSELSNNLSLVIAGPSGWGDMPQLQHENIKLLGYVPDDDLAQLYQSALAFVYPSLYEGFGYPVVEAMKYGCPVATSDTSALREVADNAALLFEPTNTDSIRQMIQNLIKDESLRQELSKKGKENAARFTWEHYYNTFIDTLQNTL